MLDIREGIPARFKVIWRLLGGIPAGKNRL
jgi:hypothetical protein